MGRKCFVPNCNSEYKSCDNKCSLFRVPQEFVHLWQKAIPRKDKILSTNDFVCEKHFTADCIRREWKNGDVLINLLHPRLKEGSVPSIFPNCPKYLTKPETKKRRVLQKHDILQPVTKIQKLNCFTNSANDSNGMNNTDINRNDTFMKLSSGIGYTGIKLPSQEWGINHIVSSMPLARLISFSKMSLNNNSPYVEKQLIMDTEGQLKLYINNYNIDVKKICTIHTVLKLEDLETILNEVNNKKACIGGPNFQDYQPNVFSSKCANADLKTLSWRHKKCPIVVEDTEENLSRCSFCTSLKQIKKKKSRRCRPARTTVSKIKMFKRVIDKKRKAQKRLFVKCNALKNDLANVKKQLTNVTETSVLEKLDSLNMSSSQKLLIMECIRMCKYSSNTGKRYTSDWLLICLLLHIRSPASYRFLRTNNILPLPTVSTIRKYLAKVNLKCGLDDNFFIAFKKKLEAKNTYQRHGICIFDEIQIRKSLRLNVKTMKFVGVQDFGQENSATATSNDQVADHALVFMFSSLTEKYSQPVAVYAVKGATAGTLLAQLIVVVIKKLEESGAIIDGIVCDGATTNRKMWSEFGITGDIDNPVNKILHPMDDSRYLYVFSDAPHLIKCVRNRLYSKPYIRTPDGLISWAHYRALYKHDLELSGNLRVCPKLSYVHLNPSNLLKMRVRLATQVFSNSVADGLSYYKSIDKTDLQDSHNTILFTKRLNDLFDALNRRTFFEGLRLGSADFKTLEENIHYLNKWEKMKDTGEITKNEFLTQTTAEGLRVTLLSTIDLCNNLLQKHGFKYVLTAKMNQDPIEQFFGIVRQAGSTNDHPNFLTFMQLYRMLSVYKLIKPPKYGNCTPLNDDQTNNPVLTFDDFKSIFCEPEIQNKTKCINNIKNKLDEFIENDNNSGDEEGFIEHSTSIPETVDCVIYYLTGFICRKLFKASSCDLCKGHLYYKTANTSNPASSLTTLKSRGFLNHPNTTMFHLLKSLEIVLMKHINSVNVYEETINEFFDMHIHTLHLYFACEIHRFDVISQALYFYTSMRLRQYQKQEENNFKKSSTESRKLAKLQKS